MISNPRNAREVICPTSHPLIKVSDLLQLHQGRGYDGNQYYCDTCRTDFNSLLVPCYHCSTCGFDLCPNCYEAQKFIQINCPRDHPLFNVHTLQLFSNYPDNTYGCNSCGSNFDSSVTPSIHCRTCTYDLCPNCLANIQAQKLNNNINIFLPAQERVLRSGNPLAGPRQLTCLQDHVLTRINSLRELYPNMPGDYGENKYYCDTCRVDSDCAVNNSYHCQICGFDVCPKCYERAQGINFNCPAGHKLMIVSALDGLYESKGYYENNGYGCDSCKGNYNAGFHPSCHCKDCGYDLCPTCFEAKKNEIQYRNQQIPAPMPVIVGQTIPNVVSQELPRQPQPQGNTDEKREEVKGNEAESDKKETSEEMLCVLCMNAPRSHLFTPCNHLCTCGDCCVDLVNRKSGCPICRSEIQSSMKVFMS